MRQRRNRSAMGGWMVASIGFWVAVGIHTLGAAGRLEAVDPAVEILNRDCSNRLGRNEVTLFENGTIRWREWQDDRKSMRLAELGRDEVEAYVRRLAASDLSEVKRRPRWSRRRMGGALRALARIAGGSAQAVPVRSTGHASAGAGGLVADRRGARAARSRVAGGRRIAGGLRTRLLAICCCASTTSSSKS